MAKVAKPKKKETSLHSRAARRGTSPSADLNVKPPVEESDYKPWLHSAHNAGITKKKKTGKQYTRQQRERHEKGMQNAERNMDKHEKKVAASKARARRVDERRAAWEELNGKLGLEDVVDGAVKEKAKTNKGVEAMKDSGEANPMEGVDSLAPVVIKAVENAEVPELSTEAGAGAVAVDEVDKETDVDEVT